MAEGNPGRRNSNTQLLEELEELSQSLYQSHTSRTRRTTSLALPRDSVPNIPTADEIRTSKVDKANNVWPRIRRMSLSPWRSRPKLDEENGHKDPPKISIQPQIKLDEPVASTEKKGIWNWRPFRALTHIGMQKLSCLFSVEVVTVQGLPASMNGLRLSVCVRKKESKDGAINTMPSRVSQGAADFEETLFAKCHVYHSPSGNGKHMSFESRPFLIYVFAVDAEEIDFGKNTVDLSRLIQESVEKNSEGTRVRQWDVSFNLIGKAKGGELVLKLGFQIMEKEGGVGIYSQAEGHRSYKSQPFSPSFGRRQSKTSFSVPSPRMTSRAEAWSPSQKGAASVDFQGIDELNLDEPAPVPSSTSSVQKPEEPGQKIEEVDLPDFEVVDKGVEIQDAKEEDRRKLVSNEDVKEIVQYQVHLTRLTELDAIAEQIKALEYMMGKEQIVKTEEETNSHKLDADEETITKEFLHMLEGEEDSDFALNQEEQLPLKLEGIQKDSAEAESKGYLPDLGKGLGCVVQTRDGGYLAAMNPLNVEVAKKDTPILAMQMTKPLVLQLDQSTSGVELFQRLAAMKTDEFTTQILSLMPIDDLLGKTAEQIAFEGIASAIIQGRNKEGASSSAARTIAAVKSVSTAMNNGRKSRISTGLWNVNEDPVAVEEILSYALQKIEAMAVEAIKIQAEMAEEEAPFDVSPLREKHHDHLLTSAVSLEDWMKDNSLPTSSTITLAIMLQLRDPIRRYEAVGGPLIALIQAIAVDSEGAKYEEENRFKVGSLHVGGLKIRTGANRSAWDSEKQRLTATQWLVAYGLGKAGKKGKHVVSRGLDKLWSISSRVMADMWLKSMRNPDVKLAN